MIGRKQVKFLTVVFCTLTLIGSRAHADSVRLATGGEIRGELSADSKGKKRPELVTVRTLSGATVVVENSQIESITPRRLLLEEYESLLRATPDALEAQWGLAEWCRQKLLHKEREFHLRRVIAHDPEHAAARRGLGHVRDKKTGEWTTQDELMAARGYVKHKGKYVLPQQLDLIHEDERISEAEKGWFKKVRMWHSWLNGSRPDRRSEALAQLKAINDSAAIPAMSRTFKDEPDDEQRVLYVDVISGISGERPIASLVSQSLWDESREVRESSIAGLLSRDATKIIPLYIRALKNRANVVVNRAGAALEKIGTDANIPQLIDALVTKHVYVTMIAEAPVSVNVDGSTPAGNNAQQLLPPQVQGMLATGQLPYGVGVIAPTPPARIREVSYEKDEMNEDVLAALYKLSGENFGFDKLAWKRWYNARKNRTVTGKPAKSGSQ